MANTRETMKNFEKHFGRLSILIEYLKKNDTGEGLILARKEVLNIIGISEGDSAKRLYELIKDPSVYEGLMRVETEGKLLRFFYAGPIEVFKEQTCLVIDKVLKLSEKKFIGMASAQTLLDWRKNGTVTYNPLIQRGEREIIDKNGNITTESIHSSTNVNAIARLIVDNEYSTDTIVFNVLNDGKSKLVYEAGSSKLMLFDTVINILDGNHRTLALSEVEDMIDNGVQYDLSQLYFPIQVENLTIEEAQGCFSQFTKGLSISSTRAEFFNNKEKTNVLLKNVMANSELGEKVETIKDTISKNNVSKVVSFATLVNALKMNFNVEDIEVYKAASDFLPEFFNELFKLIPEFNDYESRINSKKHSLKAENFAFYGYLAIASYLIDKSNWRELLANINRLDFEKDSKLWFGQVVLSGKRGLSITNKSDTRKYMSSVLLEQFVRQTITSKSA